MFENGEVKKISGPKWDEEQDSGEDYITRSFSIFIVVNKMNYDETDERVACTGEKRNTNRILVVKLEGKRPFERSTCRWGEKIKRDLRETLGFKTQICGRSLAGIPGSNPRGGHGCLSLVGVVCCQVEVSATG